MYGVTLYNEIKALDPTGDRILVVDDYGCAAVAAGSGAVAPLSPLGAAALALACVGKSCFPAVRREIERRWGTLSRYKRGDPPRAGE